eukprot:TRINITY_DN71513_c0_g1_i1.p1 TRINITY_DN71513_c0_g1~~TRINITY_DN71513_c0_g1_i1.p1  ORF type:complete len:248 (-),score=23.95 TRINITY_DN71513_c0_g1_i1:145-888(-)
MGSSKPCGEVDAENGGHDADEQTPLRGPQMDPNGIVPWPLPESKDQRVFALTSVWYFLPLPIWFSPHLVDWEAAPFLPWSLPMTFVLGVTCLIHWLDYKPGGFRQLLDMFMAVSTFVVMAIESRDPRYSFEQHRVSEVLVVCTVVAGVLDIFAPTHDKRNGMCFHAILRILSHVLSGVLLGQPKDPCAGIMALVAVTIFFKAYSLHVVWICSLHDVAWDGGLILSFALSFFAILLYIGTSRALRLLV